MRNWLDDDHFAEIVERTPLVSIDLMVTHAGRLLLGRRANPPAQDWWFVPGGRIRKGEDLPQAFARISAEELGAPLPFTRARLLGAFTHRYPDETLRGRPHVDVHYVVLAYAIEAPLDLEALPSAQHCGYRWAPPAEARADPSVHPNTRMMVEALVGP